MELTEEEEAMRAGECGPAVQWAIEHQIKVEEYLGASDFVPVTQAHVMAGTESLGAAGVEGRLAGEPADRRRLRVPTITDTRGSSPVCSSCAARLPPSRRSPMSQRGKLRLEMEQQIRAAGIRYAMVRLPEFYGPSVVSLTARVL
jgi:predicted aconitase